MAREISEHRREYLRNYQREWVAKRRADFFAGKSCERCGSTEKLELDHKDPKQKTDHKIWSWSQARRDAEIAKCQVLCHDCHVAKTWESDGRHRSLHGSIHKWKTCKCLVCRMAKAADNAERRARRRMERV